MTKHIGQTRFDFQTVVSRKLAFTAVTPCLFCGESITVRFGELMPVFRIGQEFVGLSCPRCLSEESRAELARRRQAAEMR